MSRGMSFIVPESSDFGWNLYESVWRLAHEHGTQDSVEMYRDQSNVFVFDSWVQPPKGLHSVSPATSGRAPTEGGELSSPVVGDRPRAQERKEKIVGIMVHKDAVEDEIDINIEEYERPYEGKWKKVAKGRKTNSQEDAIIPPTRPFTWRVPSWP